jgi:hypothetical protein
MESTLPSIPTLILEEAKRPPLPERYVLYQCLQKHISFIQLEYVCWKINAQNPSQSKTDEQTQFISVPIHIPNNLHKLYITSKLYPKVQIMFPV